MSTRQGIKGIYWFHLFGAIQAERVEGASEPVVVTKTITHIVRNIVHPDDYVATIAGKGVQGLPYVESFDHDPSEDEVLAALEGRESEPQAAQDEDQDEPTVEVDDDVIDVELVEELS